MKNKKVNKKTILFIIVVLLIAVVGSFVIFVASKKPNLCRNWGEEWKYNKEKYACCNEKTNECIGLSEGD